MINKKMRKNIENWNRHVINFYYFLMSPSHIRKRQKVLKNHLVGLILTVTVTICAPIEILRGFFRVISGVLEQKAQIWVPSYIKRHLNN